MNVTPFYASITFMIVTTKKILKDPVLKFSLASKQSSLNLLKSRSHATQVKAHKIYTWF